MKVFVAVLVVIVGVNALTEEQVPLVEGHTKYCAEKVGIEYEAAKDFHHSVVTDDLEANQCFTKCFMERTGFLNEEGLWQREVILTKLGAGRDEVAVEKIGKLIDKCSALVGENFCNTAYSVHNCFWNHFNAKV